MGAAPFDDDAKARYLSLIVRGRMPRMAAEDIGFTWATVQHHKRRDPAFAEAFHEAQRRALEPIEEVAYDKALEGDFNFVKLVLFNRTPEEWSDRKTVTHTGPGGGPIQVAAVSTDALREMLTNPEIRREALDMVREIPALGAPAPIEAAARETA